MSVKTNLLAAVVLSIVAGPALADSQLAASAGLTPAEAAGLSPSEIALHKVNNDESFADRYQVKIEDAQSSVDRSQLAAQAGLSAEEAKDWTLTEIVVAKINGDVRPDDRQASVRAPRVSEISRSFGGSSSNYDQLAASAGLTPSEAAGMTLNEIAAIKYDRDQHTSDRRY